MAPPKGKSNTQTPSHMQKVQPLSTHAKSFIDAFEGLASTYEDENLEPDAMKSVGATAGSLVSMALDAGLFAEYLSSLLIEYQNGLKESESKGWLRLWQKLTDMLRLRRGLSILDGTFSENCRLVVDELQRESAGRKADGLAQPGKRPRGVLNRQVADLMKAGERSPTKMAEILNKSYGGIYRPTSRKSVEGTSTYKKFAETKKKS